MMIFVFMILSFCYKGYNNVMMVYLSVVVFLNQCKSNNFLLNQSKLTIFEYYVDMMLSIFQNEAQYLQRLKWCVWCSIIFVFWKVYLIMFYVQVWHRGAEPRDGHCCWRQGEQLDPAWYQDMCFHGGMVLGVLVGQSSSTMKIHRQCHIFKGELIDLVHIKWGVSCTLQTLKVLRLD